MGRRYLRYVLGLVLVLHTQFGLCPAQEYLEAGRVRVPVLEGYPLAFVHHRTRVAVSEARDQRGRGRRPLLLGAPKGRGGKGQRRERLTALRLWGEACFEPTSAARNPGASRSMRNIAITDLRFAMRSPDRRTRSVLRTDCNPPGGLRFLCFEPGLTALNRASLSSLINMIFILIHMIPVNQGRRSCVLRGCNSSAARPIPSPQSLNPSNCASRPPSSISNPQSSISHRPSPFGASDNVLQFAREQAHNVPVHLGGRHASPLRYPLCCLRVSPPCPDPRRRAIREDAGLRR